MKLITYTVLVVVLVALGYLGYIRITDTEKVNNVEVYSLDEMKLEFAHSEQYLNHEIDQSTGERKRFAVVLYEDTPFSRDLIQGKVEATDAPINISVTALQNKIDNYSALSFIEETEFSNFKQSDGKYREILVDGEPALRYRATGLWENENIVVAQPDFVYLFTVNFNSPSDEIVAEFENIIQSILFR